MSQLKSGMLTILHFVAELIFWFAEKDWTLIDKYYSEGVGYRFSGWSCSGLAWFWKLSKGKIINSSSVEVAMDKKELKKLLTGVGLAGLLVGIPLTGGVAIGGSGWGKSGWGHNKSAVSTENSDTKVSTDKEDESAVSQEQDKKDEADGEVDDKVEDKDKHDMEDRPESGKSGWGGHK